MHSSSIIRIGIVGAGNNTRTKHIPGLQNIPGVRIVSVCNRSVASGRRVAETFDIPRVCAHWMDVVAADDVDAVVIGTWPYLHHAITCRALEAGKHVLVEARMAMNAAEARRMLAVSRRHPNVVAQVVPSPVSLGYDQTINALVADGYLGSLYAVDIRGVSEAFANPEASMTWRQDIDLSGLNTLSLGIWYEAMARWVGHARLVTAMRKVCVRQRTDSEGRGVAVRVPDHLDVLAELDCGAQAHFRCSDVMGFAEPGSGARLYGSEGTLFFDPGNDRLLGARRGETAMQPLAIPPEKRETWRVEAEFIDAIRGVAPVRLTPFTEGVKYMEFTEAVARSANQGRTIALPLPVD